MRDMICIVCPKGCHLRGSNEKDITGNQCKRGLEYAIKELTHPERQLTTTVKIESLSYKRLPVMTDKPLPKELLFQAMEELNKLIVKPPIKLGEILIKNILNQGVNIIASKTINE